MTRAKWTEAGKWLGARLFTVFLYALAIVGAANWDHDPDSWIKIAIRLGAAVLWVWMAVYRTITHWHEDREDSNG